MRLQWWMGAFAAVVLVHGAAPATAASSAAAVTGAATQPAAATPSKDGGRLVSARPNHKLASVTLGIRHRVFADFRDLQKVQLGRKFIIGDTEYSGMITRYVPDFAMDMKSRKIISRSPEPNNPAFQIVVRLKNKIQDTTWAMLKMPPHFSRKSMLAFKVARIDFVGRPPMINTDTTSALGPRNTGSLMPGAPMPKGHPTPGETGKDAPKTAPSGVGK